MKQFSIFFFLLVISFTTINCSKKPICPSTSACGCSGYNKAECEANSDCCKWTTGQGCGCK